MSGKEKIGSVDIYSNLCRERKKIILKNSNKTLKVNRDKSKILKLFLNLENDKSEKFDSVKLDNMLDVKSSATHMRR